MLTGSFAMILQRSMYVRLLHELDPSNKKYLSLSQHGERIEKQLELHENMTLITCSGTIGKVALVGRHWEKWAANQHIIRIVPASENIAGYLNIFLASEYGYHLITRYIIEIGVAGFATLISFICMCCNRLCSTFFKKRRSYVQNDVVYDR